MKNRSLTSALASAASFVSALLKKIPGHKPSRSKMFDWRGFTLALVVTLISVGLYLGQFLRPMEYAAEDFRYLLRGPREPRGDIALVNVDEPSIKELGRWPWRRDVHAKLIDILTQAGAKAIAFDILFSEPDLDHPAADAALVSAAERSGRVVFGVYFNIKNGQPDQPLWPFPGLQELDGPMGSVTLIPETDGVCRKIPLLINYEGDRIPSLSLAAWAKATGSTPEELAASLDTVTQNPWNEVSLDFLGDFHLFPYYSYADVVAGRVDLEEFRDKIVFVGGTATALFDFRHVPNLPIFPGLEIHATALDNFLSDGLLKFPSRSTTVMVILAFGLLVGLSAARWPKWTGLWTGLLLGGYFLLGQYLFSRQHFVIEFLPPAFAALAAFGVVFFYRFLAETREKRWIKSTFSLYVSPKVVDILVADPAGLKLGGEVREATIFFSDVSGFTSISEKLSPQDLVSLLNDYLSDMSDVILAHDGFLDKFIGDAIMAFWNAPLDQPHHAALACRAALEQRARLARRLVRDKAHLHTAFTMRIGINTGRVVAGNLGSNKKFNYTVIGDPVNLASRLESANKAFGTTCLITESTFHAAQEEVEARELDRLRVKGKSEPVRVFELLCLKGGLTPQDKKAYDLFAEGLAHYRQRDFASAKHAFNASLELRPGDPPVLEYLRRVDLYLHTPPPEDWDGVWALTSK